MVTNIFPSHSKTLDYCFVISDVTVACEPFKHIQDSVINQVVLEKLSFKELHKKKSTLGIILKGIGCRHVKVNFYWIFEPQKNLIYPRTHKYVGGVHTVGWE